MKSALICSDNGTTGSTLTSSKARFFFDDAPFRDIANFSKTPRANHFLTPRQGAATAVLLMESPRKSTLNDAEKSPPQELEALQGTGHGGEVKDAMTVGRENEAKGQKKPPSEDFLLQSADDDLMDFSALGGGFDTQKTPVELKSLLPEIQRDPSNFTPLGGDYEPKKASREAPKALEAVTAGRKGN